MDTRFPDITATDGPAEAPADTAVVERQAPARRARFFFQQRTGQLNWRQLARVPVDDIVERVDIDRLEVRPRRPSVAAGPWRLLTPGADVPRVHRLCQGHGGGRAARLRLCAHQRVSARPGARARGSRGAPPPPAPTPRRRPQLLIEYLLNVQDVLHSRAKDMEEQFTDLQR